MDSPLIRKIAEVQAFTKAGGVMNTKGGTAFMRFAPEVSGRLQQSATTDLLSVIPLERHALFLQKVDKTSQKLHHMMDFYVGDEWDNPIEVLEWSSFFAGAAAAHCALTSSATPARYSQTSELLGGLEQHFMQMLVEVIKTLRQARL